MHSSISIKKDELKKQPNILKERKEEPEIRPEYVKKIRRIEKKSKIKIKDIDTFFDED